MRRCHGLRPVSLLICVVLASSSSAQHEGVRWHQDLEAAKALAGQTGRLVLVHFWTTSCAPCVALDQQVFNQPGVAAAIEAHFVPVKLDADQNSATAQGFGITRVPTDVVITPSGELVGKLISPPTPSAYVAEVNQLASKHNLAPGSPFDRAVAATASKPPQINAAYANLSFGARTSPVASQPVAVQSIPPSYTQPTASTAATNRAATAPLSADNFYAPPLASGIAPPSVAPPSGAAMNSTATTPPPSQTANPHVSSPPVAPPLQAATPAITPAAPTPGYAAQGVQQPSTAVAGVPTEAPDPKLLPPGAPSLGFDGYCPVSMRNSWKWIPGDPRWGIVHRGRTYWFASQAEQQQFWSDPDRYSPALSGMDPVMQIDHKQQVPGKREHSIDYDNLFYMFCSEATLQQFTANPERYAVGVREAMGIPRGRLVR
jgi:YHS domain-containing protein/thiol-disulfide isomerase/thioredoxin